MVSCAVFAGDASQLPAGREIEVHYFDVQHGISSLLQRGVDTLVVSLLPGFDLMVAEYAAALRQHGKLRELVVIKPPATAWPLAQENRRRAILTQASLLEPEYPPGENPRHHHIKSMLEHAEKALFIEMGSIPDGSYLYHAKRLADAMRRPHESLFLGAGTPQEQDRLIDG